MSEQELIQLGFEKQTGEVEENPFYYYTLDIDGLCFITQANDDVENGEWVVEILDSPGIKFRDTKKLSTLIDILNNNYGKA